MPSWPDISGLNKRHLARVAMTLAIGLAGVFLYSLTTLPLPWFLGAMIACLLVLAFRAPIAASPPLVLLMRVILGLAIGSAFTPEMLSRAGEMTLSLAFIFPYVVVLAAIGYPYFLLFRGYNRITALLAAIPGGFQTMVAIGEDAGADMRKLSIVHSTRIMVIVFLVPLWIQFSGSADLSSVVAPSTATLSALSLKEAVLLFVCGITGYLIGRKVGISGASIIGPMLANGALHMAGIAEARVPVELVNASQLVIGCHIGCQFAGVTARELSSTVLIAIGYALLLVIGAGLFTALVVWVTGIDQNAVALAYAPGGQPEMNLVALVLNFDPAYVALHHLMRVMVIVFGCQFLISRFFATSAKPTHDRDP